MLMTEGKNRILIAEDDERTKHALGRALVMEFNAKICGASTRAEALRAIETSRGEICVIITDINMPSSEDGNAVVRRAIEENIPVIVTTAVPELVRREVRGNCLGILCKPIDLETLFKKIESVIPEPLQSSDRAPRT